ncbi:MAG: hypothetical protein J5959_03975, partial [Butyrivibrio sp.]|nr:hypothetical protein [Butyrivibrio sp.]
EHWIIHHLEFYLEATTECRNNTQAIQKVIQMFDDKVKEVRGVTQAAVSVFFNVVKFVLNTFGAGDELRTVFTTLGMNSNAVKFITNFGLDDYCSNPTGPLPAVDFSLFDNMKINYTFEDPREKYRNGAGY